MSFLARAIVFVADVDTMAGFYGDGLGLAVQTREPGWIVLGDGGAELALHAIPAHVLATLPPETGPRVDAPTKLAFAVDDVAAVRARLVARGAHMDEIAAWGTCDGHDPEGNVFQLAPRSA